MSELKEVVEARIEAQYENMGFMLIEAFKGLHYRSSGEEGKLKHIYSFSDFRLEGEADSKLLSEFENQKAKDFGLYITGLQERYGDINISILLPEGRSRIVE